MKNLQKIAHGILYVFFSIAISGCSDTATITSAGTGLAPSIQISPVTNFDFGTVTVGNAAAPLEVLITNNGEQRLDVNSISLSDTLNFQLNAMSGTNPCGTMSPAISGGESCTIEIAYTPNQSGVLTAILEITSNDPGGPIQLGLTGTSAPVDTGLNSLNVTINQIELACPEVTAYVSVTDQANFPVEGLSAGDFTITEGSTDVGIPLSSTVGVVTAPISIALAMDYSGSMQAIDIAEMEKAAIKIIEQLNPSDKAAIIKFDGVVYIEQKFTSDKALLIAAINNNIPDGSNTALYDAVQAAVELTAANLTSTRKAVILITDGKDTNSNAILEDIIANAATKGIPVFVVALGDNIDITALQAIAVGTSGEFYEADVAQNLRTILQQQLSEVLFTDQYILTYVSSSAGSSIVDLAIDVATSDGLSFGVDSRPVTLCPPP